MDIRFCLIGFGTVGRSFLQLLKEKKNILKNKFNLNLIIVAIFEYDGALINEEGFNLEMVLDKRENFRELPFWKNNEKPENLLNNNKLDVKICVEATPTNPKTGEPGLSHIVDALNNGINVVSSNKGPFYLQYKKIKDLANKNNCIVKYEAAVACVVPALSMAECLIGNQITRIKAILNGTCNYILSRMTAEGIPFSTALKEAQELGIAEADPTLDIEGFDAAGKIVILANELLGLSKNIKDVTIKGISKITPQAIELAKTDGLVIKHLAIVEDDEILVEPRLIKSDSPLNISGTLNIIEFQTQYSGPIILMGRGAGGYEAASAILNDLINVAINKGYATKN